MKMISRCFKIVVVAAAFVLSAKGQNNLILQLENGAPFRVLVNDKVYNDSAQAQVQIFDLVKDTVFLKVREGGSQSYGVTFYLLDKGKKTKGKEFTYLLRKEKNRLQPVFMGMNEVHSFPPKNEARK